MKVLWLLILAGWLAVAWAQTETTSTSGMPPTTSTTPTTTLP